MPTIVPSRGTCDGCLTKDAPLGAVTAHGISLREDSFIYLCKSCIKAMTDAVRRAEVIAEFGQEGLEELNPELVRLDQPVEFKKDQATTVGSGASIQHH